MKKNYIVIVILVIILGIGVVFAVGSTLKKKGSTVIQTTESKPIELCFYRKSKTSSGLYDVAWLKINIMGGNVTGEFQNIPAEKDKKVGTFEGTVGAVDKVMMARTADVWWNSMAEGMQAKEQLKIVFGEGNAEAQYGEMVDRGDGVYVYKDSTKLTPGISMADVACSDLDQKI